MKMIKKLISLMFFLLAGCVTGALLVMNILGSRVTGYKQLAEKHLYIMEIFKVWMMMLEKGQKIETYFLQNGYKTIAIYGMGYLGDRLLAELAGTDVEVKYLIDRQLGSVYGNIPVCSINDDLESVDVIVITPVYYFYSIRRQLREKTDNKLISIEDIFK